MSGVLLPSGRFAEWARAFHMLAAVVALLASSALCTWSWYRREPLQNPLPAILIAVALIVGTAFARTMATRLQHASRTNAVSALLRLANAPGAKDQEGTRDVSRARHNRLMLTVMSLQIALTGLAGLAASVVLLRFAGPAALSAGDVWPGVAFIVLLEAMYVAWLAEGQAVADELTLVAHRWMRATAIDGPSPIVVGQQPPAEEPFVARARFLGEVLARYGVDWPPSPAAPAFA